MMTLDDLKQLVTPEGVKNALEPQLYTSLTGDSVLNASPTPKNSLVEHDEFDDDYETFSNARMLPVPVVTACGNAAMWGYVTLMQADALCKPYSEDQQAVIGMALVNRAIYELGRISQFDVSFHSNKKDAQAMFDAVLGRVPATDGQSSSYFVGASITKDEKTKSQNLNPLYRFTQRNF